MEQFFTANVGDDEGHGDCYILHHSSLIEFLQNHPLLCLFQVLGDSAFLNNDVMKSTYREQHLPPASLAFNAVMCPIRKLMGWGYEAFSFFYLLTLCKRW